ncbi:MAG: hypothetical protein O3A00_17650 [Planctomycetota bacterium]|nr:hypothetical protein [Planctomycetota bacterium]
MSLPTKSRHGNRAGFTMVEFTAVGAVLTVVVVATSAIWTGLLKPMRGSVAQLRIAQEARLATESILRDFSGSDPSQRLGTKTGGRLVGARVVNSELQLCFDGSPKNATADWALPDSTITYTVTGNRLERIDNITGNAIPIAADVDAMLLKDTGASIELQLTFERRQVRQQYELSLEKP